MIYYPEWALAGLVHAFFGITWMGMHMASEILLVPDFHKAEKLADMPLMRKVPLISKVQGILGILTLLTGLIFLFVKFGTDIGSFPDKPEARTVLIALGVVVGLLVFGFGILKKRGEALGKRASTMKPMDPLPDDFKAELMTIGTFLHIQAGGVLVVFVLMILAIHGGI